MCCTLLLAAGIGPRIALLFVWIFGDRVEHAFDSWVWPLLGLLFLPWTTLAYIFAWGSADGVSGWGWVLVGAGIALDIATYSSRAVRRGQQTA